VEPVPNTVQEFKRVPHGVSPKQAPYTTGSISNTIGSGIIYTTVPMSELEVAAPLRMDELTFAEEGFSISNCVMSSNNRKELTITIISSLYIICKHCDPPLTSMFEDPRTDNADPIPGRFLS